MNEAKLKGDLTKLLRSQLRNAIIFRHEDFFTAGIPDISLTWNGKTLWLEVKHAKPRLRSKEIQILTTRRLAQAGNCLFVIYYEGKHFHTFMDVIETRIVSPVQVHFKEWKEQGISTSGFNHQFVVDYIKEFLDETH